jgi:hypothetical protein
MVGRHPTAPTPGDATNSHVHVLNARIINKNNEILFANQNRIQVKLLGIGRTTFIDIPVVPYTSMLSLLA